MSKSGTSVGATSGAGRKGREGAGAERADRQTKTPRQHAAGRKGTDAKLGEDRRPGRVGATRPAAAKSKSQQKKMEQQARAIAKKKAKK
jgi:hypothetical protein